MGVVEAERTNGTDRRWWPRAAVRLPLRVVDTEGGFGVIGGETLNISVGGLAGCFDGPLPGTVATTIQVDLGADQVLTCEALIAGGGPVGESWEYRLAFQDVEPEDAEALDQLVRQLL
ncbi:MAG: PilZ domain-containing protein [Acidimicrobiales bacterium]